jgi:hypothetical protein
LPEFITGQQPGITLSDTGRTLNDFLVPRLFSRVIARAIQAHNELTGQFGTL